MQKAFDTAEEGESMKQFVQDLNILRASNLKILMSNSESTELTTPTHSAIV